jgi:hypothetical protein
MAITKKPAAKKPAVVSKKPAAKKPATKKTQGEAQYPQPPPEIDETNKSSCVDEKKNSEPILPHIHKALQTVCLRVLMCMCVCVCVCVFIVLRARVYLLLVLGAGSCFWQGLAPIAVDEDTDTQPAAGADVNAAPQACLVFVCCF